MRDQSWARGSRRCSEESGSSRYVIAERRTRHVARRLVGEDVRVVVRALAGRPGRSTASVATLLPITTAKIEGSTSKVANVDITSPPITARPSGACIWLPRSSASAIGTMPTVMAQAVIRIGRSRSPAPTMAASVEDAPPSSARP